MAEKRAARGEAIRLRAAQQLKQQQTQLEQLEQQQQATAAAHDSGASIMHERSTQLQVSEVSGVYVRINMVKIVMLHIDMHTRDSVENYQSCMMIQNCWPRRF